MPYILAWLLLHWIWDGAATAQSLSTAQSPPGIDWRSLPSEKAQVIFPKPLEASAQYVSKRLQHYGPYVGLGLNMAEDHQSPFPLILRPGSGMPNGFVTVAPQRSEFLVFKTITPELGGLGFLDILSIHEYRHILQFNKALDSGIEIAWYLLGDIGWAGSILFSTPSWFMEGDAVWAETAFTEGGRGRSPRFWSRLKADLLAGKTPQIEHFIFGSDKAIYPNHYVIGYFLVSRGYQKFGADIWGRIMERLSAFPYPLRLYNIFEEETGEES